MDILNFISWIRGGRVVTTVDPTQTLLPVGLKDERRDDGYLAGAISVADLLALVPPGGLSGTNYVYVAADGTDIENAAELQAAYAEAITRVPSATNRITVIAAPGYYNFGSTNFIMTDEYIDLVSLDGNRSIIFNSLNPLGTINIVANDVFVKGVDVTIGLAKSFIVADFLNLLKVDNCRGGNFSFGNTSNGTFTDCVAGNNSFGVTAAFGTYTNCTASFNSFGGVSASGLFTNCTAGQFSFGGVGTAIGLFTDCIANNFSFGANDANGTFRNCVAADYSFGGGNSAPGNFTDCTAGNFSFGGGNSASGLFRNCTAGLFSFGGSNSAIGVFTNCVAGNNSFGSANIASGIFTNCTAGIDSFGFFGSLTGKLYYCRLTAGTFQTVSLSGVTRYCLDGSNVANNQG